MRRTGEAIERARQRVAETELRITAQRGLIHQLKNAGRPSAQAERLLDVMVNLLKQRRDHLREMARDTL